MRRDLARGLLLLRKCLAATRKRSTDRLDKHMAFLDAKDLLKKPIWDLLRNQSDERRSIAMMLRLAMGKLSFIPSKSGSLTEPTRKQLILLVAIVDILRQENVSRIDERDVDERLRAVGLEVGLEIDDLDAFKVDEGDIR